LPMSLLSNLPMWTSVFMQWDDFLWQFPRSFLQNHLVHIITKQVAVILRINFYIKWQKINTNHSFWILKHACQLFMTFRKLILPIIDTCTWEGLFPILYI
jgi:hypothetical protein